MRIGGIASGLDIDQIVSDLMKVERTRLDSVYQKKVQTEWRRDEYRTINTKLLSLRNFAFDMQLQSSYTARKAESSNSNAISVSASGRSQPGEYRIHVEKLATSATLISPGNSDDVDVEANFTAFMESYFSEDAEGNRPAEYTLQVSANGGTEYKDVSIVATDTFEDVLRKISSETDVNAFYDKDGTGQVVFTTRTTGESAKVSFAVPDSGPNFQKEVFRKNSSGDYVGWNWSENRGENAVLEINGLSTERESNTFDLAGTTVTLLDSTEAAATITVSQDVDQAFDRIKKFVELYNETIDYINGKLTEPLHRDYLPLTDEQKEAMSDREIELWEEKSKSGMLRNDSMLSGILADMRMALGSSVEGLEGISSLSQIGIKTGLWQERGKLHIDEDELREALTENPEGVMALFTNNGDSDKELGIARKMHNSIGAGIDRLADRAGSAANLYDQSFLSEEIRRYEERMETIEDRLVRTEERYWNQFIAMERALEQMYSQSDWLTQQLAGLQG